MKLFLLSFVYVLAFRYQTNQTPMFVVIVGRPVQVPNFSLSLVMLLLYIATSGLQSRKRNGDQHTGCAVISNYSFCCRAATDQKYHVRKLPLTGYI